MKNTYSPCFEMFVILAVFFSNPYRIQSQSVILGHTYAGTHEGHSYYLSDCYTGWEEANDAASQMGGYLASVTTEEENDFVHSFASVVAFSVDGGEIRNGEWIGLIHQNGAWTWSNGEPLDYENWGFNEFTASEEPVQCCYGLTGRVTSAGDFNYWFTSTLFSFYYNRRYILEFDNDPACNNPNKTYVCHNGNTICVNNDAVQAHLNHGDYSGSCGPCNSNSMQAISQDVSEFEYRESKLAASTSEGFQNDVTINSDFKIFPNPTHAEVNIMLPEMKQGGTLHILNLTGQEIESKTLPDHQVIINLSAYPAGVYVIELRSTDTYWRKKIVKL